MDGILLVDKPAGWTSHDVVAKVRSILRQQTNNSLLITNNQDKLSVTGDQLSVSRKVKVGHTGTLDPMATGLLILVIGSYTKRAGEFSQLDKIYEAELTLGAVSTTGDREGKITAKSAHKPSQDKIETIMSTFLGGIEQSPHIYSAVKVDGQRAYKLARQGQAVELKPRKVTIYEISVSGYEYPKLQIRAKVSSGTYIRSLAEDIGEALGTGAYLSALRRTQIGQFKAEDAKPLAKIAASTCCQITPDLL